MACIVMACIVMAYIAMAHTVMAYIAMACCLLLGALLCHVPIMGVRLQANLIFRAAIKEADDGKKWVNTRATWAEGWVNNYPQGLGSTSCTQHQCHDWLPAKYNLTQPSTGFITNLDGKPSPQVHQYDRFGQGFKRFWLEPYLKSIRTPVRTIG